ncbi:hypothetical protein C4D60_Mb01t05850 [Musa balbisiana]|uniref:Anoctamin transmembrane domain-containing protein n=1 Tax=Musa balbisiana TaxID=52838 RepID=A0A4S8JKZ3_MUSBA|nr:hypothetical protein C4D60_Mb01t05850 [Musa balbisiana]
MEGHREVTGFEVAIVVPKKREKERDDTADCVEFLVRELKRAGLIVERVFGISDEFIKLAAPVEILGRVAAELQMKKLTYIGIELQFEWDEVTAFVRQPDGSLFSWLPLYPILSDMTRPLVLPAFFIFVVTWAVFFFQFWKRKNSALLARWGINYTLSEYKAVQIAQSSFLHVHDKCEKRFGDEPIEKKILQRDEWLGLLLRIRNNAIIVLAIICLQLPFELAYAHLYEVTESDVLKYALTAAYLLAIQYYTRIGGKVSVILIKYEKDQGEESSAASLVYKVFGLYFMQSYIGLFYHALSHRNLLTLRQVLENMIENSIPYLKYSYKKYKAFQ